MVLDPIRIDRHISQESVEKMIACFKPSFINYLAGETILRFSDEGTRIAIVLSGKARLIGIDPDGEIYVLESYSSRDVFGELFSLPLENFEYIVEAIGECKIMYLDYNHTISPCDHVCPHHSQLISNLFHLAAQKSQALMLHVNILNQHTIRKKLVTYLQYIQSNQSKSVADSFEIPMSLVNLAEYLCVDRSAMMREIRLLKEEGVLKSNRRHFTFL